MAKKKDIAISPEMLAVLNKQNEEDNKKLRQKKEERETLYREEMTAEEQNQAVAEYANRVAYTREYIDDYGFRARPTKKKFDRKRERPIQKTVHLTIEVDNKVNMIKSVLKTLGKKTTFEDFLFDLLDNWLKEHYDEVLSGKVVYPGENN